MKAQKLSDVAVLMRLEVARKVNLDPVWFLLDWVQNQSELPNEVMRVLQRFNRIVLSLSRQQAGRSAKYEPYKGVIGVRVKMGQRVIGVWPEAERDSGLAGARTATAAEHLPEAEYAAWLERQVVQKEVHCGKESNK